MTCAPATSPATGQPQGLPSPGLIASPAVFSHLEVTVLDLARREAHQLHSFDRVAFRGLRRKLGFNEPQPLADTRLEALREYATRLERAQSTGSLPQPDDLVTVGFSPAQVGVLHRAFAHGWSISQGSPTAMSTA